AVEREDCRGAPRGQRIGAESIAPAPRRPAQAVHRQREDHERCEDEADLRPEAARAGASEIRCHAEANSAGASRAALNTVLFASRRIASFSPYSLKSPPTRVACSGVSSPSPARA